MFRRGRTAVDERLARQVRGVRYSSRKDLETAIIETLIEISDGSLTVRAARNRLGAVLRAARNGTVQLVGREPEETVVIVAFANLVDLIDIALRQCQTLAEALDEIGFKPLGRGVVADQIRREKGMRKR